jgi:hypothetical protein
VQPFELELRGVGHRDPPHRESLRLPRNTTRNQVGGRGGRLGTHMISRVHQLDGAVEGMRAIAQESVPI